MKYYDIRQVLYNTIAKPYNDNIKHFNYNLI